MKFVKKRETVCKKRGVGVTVSNGTLYCKNILLLLRGKRHGERRAIVTQLLRNVSGNLDLTYVRNERKDFFKFLTIVKGYKISYSLDKYNRCVQMGLFSIVADFSAAAKTA
jgi:hypothetical protein